MKRIYCLAVFLSLLSMVLPDVCEASDTNSAIYPNIAYRTQGRRILYPAMNDHHFILPNGLQDVVMDVSKIGDVWYATTFFGNKRIRLKDVKKEDSQSLLLSFPNGDKTELSPILPGADVDIHFKATEGIRINFGFLLSNGSFVGNESFLHFINTGGIRPLCMISDGISFFDANQRNIWRKTYIHRNSMEPYRDDWGACRHYPGQNYLSPGGDIYPLSDGTFIVAFADYLLVRISETTGLPLGRVPNFSVIDTRDVINFNNVAFERIFPKTPLMETDGSDAEAAYYRLEDAFFFLNKN